MQKKVIIETNWWVSFIISKHSGELPDFFFNKLFDFYFSQELLEEIANTLNYPRIKKRLNKTNFKKYIQFISESAVMIGQTSNITICRDAKDNFLLALAKDAGADFFITRDEDLLVVKHFENTSILTLPQFIEIIDKNL